MNEQTPPPKFTPGDVLPVPTTDALELLASYQECSVEHRATLRKLAKILAEIPKAHVDV